MATSLNVPISAVQLTITSASVRLQFDIAYSDAATASAASTSLGLVFANPAAASTFLTTPQLPVSVVSIDPIAETLPSPLPPPPSPPPSPPPNPLPPPAPPPGFPVMALLVIVAVGLIVCFVCCLVAALFWMQRNQKDSAQRSAKKQRKQELERAAALSRRIEEANSQRIEDVEEATTQAATHRNNLPGGELSTDRNNLPPRELTRNRSALDRARGNSKSPQPQEDTTIGSAYRNRGVLSLETLAAITYKVGEEVLVKRSSGEETEATVHEYILEKDAYIVVFNDGKTRKQCTAAELRPAPVVEKPKVELEDDFMGPYVPKIFARGAKVLVKRSNGEETEATIHKYDILKEAYWVTLNGKTVMLNPQAELRLVEQPTADEAALIDEFFDSFGSRGGAAAADEAMTASQLGIPKLKLAASDTNVFAYGTRVLIKRSSGQETEATIDRYDRAQQCYWVTLPGRSEPLMLNANTEIRPVEQPDFGVLADFGAAVQQAPSDSVTFARGTKVLVKRSSGEEQEATIHKYDTMKQAYFVILPGKTTPVMLNPAAELRAAEPAPSVPNKPQLNTRKSFAQRSKSTSTFRPMANEPAAFAIGTKVLVKRSNGEETDATVQEYDALKGEYNVRLSNGSRKIVGPELLRAMPPPAVEVELQDLAPREEVQQWL